MISPRILPTNFTSGKEIPSYEFNNSSVAARQLGFGQVPPLSFFAGEVQFRGTIGKALSYDRLKDLEPNVDMALLANWQVASFVTTPFTQWWSEWQEHLFCKSINLYCTALYDNYQAENEVQIKSIFITFLSTFCLHLLTITPCRMMIETLQQSVEAASRSTTLCRPTSPTSAIMLHLLRMWPLGENVSYPLPR